MPLSYDFFISHRLAGIYRRKPRIKLLCTFFHKNALFYGAGNCRKMPRFFCAIGLQKGYFWVIPFNDFYRLCICVFQDFFTHTHNYTKSRKNLCIYTHMCSVVATLWIRVCFELVLMSFWHTKFDTNSYQALHE